MHVQLPTSHQVYAHLTQIAHSQTFVQLGVILAISVILKIIHKKFLHSIIKMLIRSMADVQQAFKYPVITTTRKIFFPVTLSLCIITASEAFQYLEMGHAILEGFGTTIIFYSILKSLAILGNKEKSNFVVFFVIFLVVMQKLGVDGDIEKILSSVNFYVIDFKISLYKVLRAVFMIIILQWLVSIILISGKKIIKGAKRSTSPHTDKGHERELHYKIFSYLVYFLSFIVFLTIVGVQSSHIALVGSAIGLGIGFGLQKIASNFFSGIILLVEKSVKLGDILELEGGQIGTVRSLGVRSTIVTTFDGKDMIIPNEQLTTKEAINYTLIDNSIRLSANFQIVNKKDIKTALEIMRRACLMQKDISRTKKIICCARDTNEKGIHLMSLFWIHDFAQDDVLRIKSNVISTTILMMLENDIELYFERSTAVLRDTLHRITNIENDASLPPPFVNRFANRPSVSKTQDITSESALNTKKFSDF